MVSSRSLGALTKDTDLYQLMAGVNISPAKNGATNVGMSDSVVAHGGNAISPNDRQSYSTDDGTHVNRSSGIHEWSQSGPPSLSMSLGLQHLENSNPQDSGHFSGNHEGSNVPSTTNIEPSCTVKVTGSRDDEESYEAFGSVNGDGDDGANSPEGSCSTPSPTGTSSLKNSRSPNSTIGRHSWLRTSIRRTPPCAGRKRLSSNALASQLYRSGSFNSSGRGSTCDPTDDMYSDVSLEEDVIDLNHKVQMIQEQMNALQDTQSVGEERYARVKQENATLQARVLMLEEAAKDAEARAEERLQAEQRRHKEWSSRLERERQLQLENYTIKLQAVEQESSGLRNEICRLREQLEKIKTEKNRLETALEEAQKEAATARDNERHAISRANEAHYELEAAREELALRLEDQHKIEELMQEVIHLRAQNKSLEESRDELQAAAALHAGRELLMLSSCNNSGEKGPSLAVELLAGMNEDQMDGQMTREYGDLCSMSEIKQALKEQQEVNAQLRTYIDGILLNIVENSPQLLEVKQTH